ncbi:MAG: hypothetical protein ACP5LH_01705 [Candidatus Micrarchaeia archaeon]
MIAEIIYPLLLSLMLGLIHGITPDEHTWPITFSYAIGVANAKKGAEAGLLFSVGFTIQRALLAELAYLALLPFLLSVSINAVIYVLVGIVMSISGFYILKKHFYIHFHRLSHWLNDAFHTLINKKGNAEKEHIEEHEMFKEHPILDTRKVPLKLTLLHGFIAGFGFGAFALILYTAIVPQMPNAYIAWLPGALFGIGTMIMQISFGYLISKWMHMRKYTKKQIEYISSKTAGRILAYAGLAFILSGFLLYLIPDIGNWGIRTPINIPNLDVLDIGFFLVIISIVIVAIPSYYLAVKESKYLDNNSKINKKLER